MDSQINGDNIVSDLLRAFNQDNVILFAGKEAVINGELTKAICSFPWSCIVTTCKEEDFGVKFAASGRTTIEITSFDDIPLNLYNRSELPIVYLFGKESVYVTKQEDDDEDEEFRVNKAKNQAEKILNRIMTKMDIRSRMVVVGYNANHENEIAEDKFIFSWEEMQGGVIELFYSALEPAGKIKKYAQKRNYIWYDGKLSNLIENVEEVYDFKDIVSSSDTNIFYKGKNPVAIKAAVLSRYHTFVQLLTEEKINRIRPLGRSQQSRWFYNFLNNSSDYPQWYGFMPQSEFYLKRDYEEILIATVKNLLSNKNLYKSGKNTPVILEGDSGGSKSIELAALAYRIFEEKINPVIFINGNSFYFASQSNELEILDELMQEVESLGDKDTRFLLIWDSSSYKNVIAEANQLAHELENRGRRFVLVCSAYRNILNDEDKHNRQNYRYNTVNQKFERINEDSNIYFLNNCYFISASRRLSDKELWQLKKKTNQYSGVDSLQINRIWDELSNNNDFEISKDVLQYFYRLIILIRPKLEAGLSREQRLIDRYVRKQMSLFEQKEGNTSPMRDAFLKAGIELNENDLKIVEEIEEVEEENNFYNLDRFNICIAMFSRFKLDVSYSLALRMLCDNSNEYFGKNQAYNNYELFKLLTSQINYIHYVEATDSKFVFRFRSTLEAEIFLKNNQVSEEQQIDIILQMIDFYIENYKKTFEVDFDLKEAIQSIIKMYGPNTDYRDFWEGGSCNSQHRKILSIIYKIADKLYEVRNKWKIPDNDCGFAILEVNLYRELFGTQWGKLHNATNVYQDENPWEEYPEIYNKDAYEMRLKKLTDALELAQNSLENLENQQLDSNNFQAKKVIQSSITNMLVELVHTNKITERIYQEFKRFANINNLKNIDSLRTLSYSQLYPRLFKVISKDPWNGYLYNALFSMFEKEYEKTVDQERKLHLLSDVRMIADDASTLEIQNRGSKDIDELSKHLAKIAQYSSCYKVYIADIVNNKIQEPFKNLFESMIARNNASGLCFVCQQELELAKLDGKSIADYESENDVEFVLNQHQIAVCRSIVNFLKKPEYQACVEKSTQALYLLFRVEWMLYNKRPISISNEWQKTYLDGSEWLCIHDTCEKYENVSRSTMRPIVTLIYALAKIHKNREYVNAARTMYKLGDMHNQRMRVPYLICFTPGVAEKFNGTVMTIDKDKRNGFIKVNGLPAFTEINQGVKFFVKNLGGRRHMPKKGEVIFGFELGLMWTGQYSAHKTDDGGELHG